MAPGAEDPRYDWACFSTGKLLSNTWLTYYRGFKKLLRGRVKIP